MVILLYVLISVVTVGHLSFSEAAAAGDHALADVAMRLAGSVGHALIAAAAVLACGSAINATLYSSGRLTYMIARSGELPQEFEREIRGVSLEGTIVFAVMGLILANFVPLDAITTMASAGFLFIFMAVNFVNVRLAKETQSMAWISALGALSCAAALALMCIKIEENPHSRNHLWILVGMVAFSLAIEVSYRAWSGRSIRVAQRERKPSR